MTGPQVRRALTFAALLLGLCLPAAQAVEPRPLTPSTERQPLTNVEYLFDKEATHTIREVASGNAGEFQPLIKKTFGFGYFKEALWVRFALDLKDHKEPYWFLTQKYEHVGTLTLYYPAADEPSGFRTLQIDENQPVEALEFKIHNYLLKVPTPDSAPTTYYLRIAPAGHVLSVDLEWSSLKGTIEQTNNIQLGIGLFFGALLAIWFYNAALFLYLRSREYFYYIYYLGCFICMSVYMNGLAPLIINLSPFYEGLFAASAFLGMHGMILFARRFLSLGGTLPKLDLYLRGCQWLSLSGAVAAMFLPVGVPWQFSNLVVLTACPALILSGALRWRQGYAPARLYSIGWTVFIAAIGILVLRSTGALPPNWFTNYAFQMGSVWESILFSFALAYRIKLVEKQSAIAKNEFIGMISHELRTPLQRMVSSIDLLSVTLSKNNIHTPALDRLSAAVDRFEVQIDDLTDYARLESGNLQLRETQFNTSDLVKRVADDYRQKAEEKGLEFRTEITDCDFMVCSDAMRIEQVLNNLVGNAIKYTDRGFVKMTLQYRQGKDLSLVMRVEDSGPGIDPQNFESLFKPFTQIDQSSARRYDGIGMGLAIVKRLVTLLGGITNVDSTPGKGTVFEVIIPVRRVADMPTTLASGGKQRILLVDDNLDVRVALQEVTEQLGYLCEVAASGAEALSMAATKRYDAILLDINMPGLDGYAVSHEIRSRPGANQHTPVIWISATAPQIASPEKRKLFTFFLEKPVRSKKLDAMLKQLFGGGDLDKCSSQQ